jgi:hypothetical protein
MGTPPTKSLHISQLVDSTEAPLGSRDFGVLTKEILLYSQKFRSPWKIGENFLGNRHTGIRRMNPRDRGNGTKACMKPFFKLFLCKKLI